MNSAVRTFGEILPGIQYVERPGAYAFIQNSRRDLAIVQTPNGLFLPGGGVVAGETIEVGLARELFEEIGFSLSRATFIVQAIQYHWSEHYKSYFKKIGSFFETEGHQPTDAKFEKDHGLIWLPPREAERALTQEFQRWAVSHFTRGG